MKVTAFNDGKVGVETLKLTREIGDITEKLSADDKNLIMEFLCVYADKDGSFSNDPLVNRSFNGQLSLLNVVVASLRNMKDDLVEYKKNSLTCCRVSLLITEIYMPLQKNSQDS